MSYDPQTPGGNAGPRTGVVNASGTSARDVRAAIPAFINPKAGSAEQIEEALKESGGFDLRPPDERDFAIALREELERGTTRILVAGGDGTVRSAAEVVAGTTVELAIIPGGTLNHFAKFHEIPEDPKEAASTAAGGVTKQADAAYVNDSLFLNTSSVGAYVKFVRVRERLEKLHIPYAIASLVAVLRTLVWLRTFRITLNVDGVRREIDTPLVFIAVGEREMQFPTLGDHKEGGARGLHIVVIEGRGRARLMLMSAAIVARGADGTTRAPASGVQSFMSESLRIDTRRARVGVALDGEIKEIGDPLEYRFARDTLTVIVPGAGDRNNSRSGEG
ncbi:MAG: NAD(+)/NADH kinase [Anaerolineae bacterium]|nr:NAD(+)/NADH kinase [Gemmatimonadaceae bacterium]